MRAAAASVHVFTALGAVCALMAALALLDRHWEMMFLWLGIAFIIDGVDGMLARWVKVTERLPRFSGERLDLVIDFVTYVFLPAVALVHAGLLQGALGVALAAAIVMSSLFHFADLDSKDHDHSFVGFPALWNVVAFYLFAWAASPAVATGVVVLCVALTFVPWRWVHPFRVQRLRSLTVGMAVLWAVATVWTVLAGFPAGAWAKVVLALVAAYGVGLVLFRHVRNDIT